MTVAKDCLLQLSTAPDGSTAAVHFLSIKDRFNLFGSGLESNIDLDQQTCIDEDLVSNLETTVDSTLNENLETEIIENLETETCQG